MFNISDVIQKDIITPDGESEFQIRYIADEDVGLLTTRSDKSYFILDSGEHWYDLIQEQYPPKKKCRCKNDFFRIRFEYITRVGTDDFCAVKLVSRCTACGKQRVFAEILIDYSPTLKLLEQPIEFCNKPKIKCKSNSVGGYWEKDELYALLDFLSTKSQAIYCWYWNRLQDFRVIEKFTFEELTKFLFENNGKYLAILFSSETEELDLITLPADEKGVYVRRDIWRKKNIIMINSPIPVAHLITDELRVKGHFHSLNFSSEYIDTDGSVKKKDTRFCGLVQQVLAYCKQNLK